LQTGIVYFILFPQKAELDMEDISMELIEMKDIKKDYFLGETVVHALRGVDLTIEREEFVAIWGPSGSGKTTLLNLVGAIDETSSGYEIAIEEE